MGLFDRKRPKIKSNHDKVTDLILEIKDLLDEDASLSAIILSRGSKHGSSLVQGHSGDIRSMIRGACAQDPNFAEVINDVAEEMNGGTFVKKGSKADMTPEIKKIFDQMGKDRSKVVDLPGGGQALAINTDDLDNISKEEVDKIIDALIKGAKNSKSDSDSDKSED